MSEANLRPLKEADREQYFAMCRDFYNSDAVDHSVPEEHFVRTFSALMAGSVYAACKIVEWNGQVAGYVLLARTWSQEGGGETLWVDELYILPQYRGRGLGKFVFARLKEEFPDTARIRLEVQPENARAQHLYRRLGYEFLNYRQMILDFGCN